MKWRLFGTSRALNGSSSVRGPGADRRRTSGARGRPWFLRGSAALILVGVIGLAPVFSLTYADSSNANGGDSGAHSNADAAHLNGNGGSNAGGNGVGASVASGVSPSVNAGGANAGGNGNGNGAGSGGAGPSTGGTNNAGGNGNGNGASGGGAATGPNVHAGGNGNGVVSGVNPAGNVTGAVTQGASGNGAGNGNQGGNPGAGPSFAGFSGPFTLAHMLNIIIPSETTGSVTVPPASAVSGLPVVNLTSWDISWFDQATKTYYLADRTHSGVDVVDGRTNFYVGRFTGFVGNTGTSDTSGPNGVLTTESSHELWAGDGNSTVKVFDLKSGSMTHNIPTGGSSRADELAFDQADHLIMVANDAESSSSISANAGASPFVSFISTQTYQVVGGIIYDGLTGTCVGGSTCPTGIGVSGVTYHQTLQATDGLEQPVWDQKQGLFLFSVPQTTTNVGGQIDVISPSSMTVVNSYPLSSCHPQGLVQGPDENFAVGCGSGGNPPVTVTQSYIINGSTGAVVATITQVHGSDEVWFNPGDGNYYFAASNCNCTATGVTGNGPVLGVVNGVTNTWIENVRTGPSSHSVAANPMTNEVYVPLKDLGVGVYVNTSALHDHGVG